MRRITLNSEIQSVVFIEYCTPQVSPPFRVLKEFAPGFWYLLRANYEANLPVLGRNIFFSRLAAPGIDLPPIFSPRIMRLSPVFVRPTCQPC